MSAHDHLDDMFDRNLHAAAQRIEAPSDLPADVRRQCRDTLAHKKSARQAGGGRILRRPALLSTLGLAASIALAAILVWPGNGGPSVEAGVILAKLKEKLAAPQLLEITIESITIDEVSLDGRLQISRSGVGGDIHVRVEDPGDSVELDASLGLSPEKSWLLVRKLVVSDSDARPIVNALFPPGAETLLILPQELDIGDFNLDLSAAFETLASKELVGVLQQMIDRQSEIGATVKKQRDGTLLLTLPIEDASSLNELIVTAARMAGEDVTKEVEAEIRADGLDDDDLGPLLGSTLEVVYDPANERVQSFTLANFGEAQGTISVRVGDGEIDANLLDSSRVTSSKTRTLDLSALVGLIEGLSKQ
jgi:hypothetical protein